MERTLLQAHRGVSTDYPENTMAAFIGSAVQGYPIIETDPAYTSDGEILLLHDKTVNRTGRNLDGTPIPENTEIASLTYAEVSKMEFGSWFDEKFKGEPIPRLEDLLRFAAQFDIIIKLDNKMQYFPEDIQEKLFAIVEASPARVGITASQMEYVRKVHARLPNADIHYDGVVTEEALQELSTLIAPEKLIVWVPYPSSHNYWVKIPFISEELAQLVKKYARLGVWLLSEESDYRDTVERFCPYAVETTGKLKPSNTAHIG